MSKFKVDSSRIPAPFHGFNIVHLSDLHGTLYGRHHEQLFHEIQQAGPDVVVMTGSAGRFMPQALPTLDGVLCVGKS